MKTIRNLTQIEGVKNLDTSQVTNMSSMFWGVNSVETLDVSGFDTSQVTDMSWMFRGVSSMQTLDVSSLDTNQVW